jgi:hypothetical protein
VAQESHFETMVSSVRMPVLKVFDQLVNFHKDLSVQKQGEFWVVSGLLSFESKIKEKTIKEAYDVEIKVTKEFPYVLPAVKETGGRVPKVADNHVYTDTGFLCLGTEMACVTKAINSRSLLKFVNEQVVPFLGGYAYCCRYGGGWPYGELSHGSQGIVEYYRDYFGVNDNELILSFIRMALEWNETRWDKSTECMCKSGEKLGVCHYELVRAMSKPLIRKTLNNDYFVCENHFKRIPVLNRISRAINKTISQNEKFN